MARRTGTTAPATRLDSVSKTYPGASRPVLREVTTDFPAGAMTAVMGPSGSGKTTLLHCAAGLQRPSGGRVLLGETDLTACDDRQLTVIRRRRLGFVFQEFNLLPTLTAYDNVALPLRLNGNRPKRRVVLDALRQVGLAELAGRRPAQLSGGQQQRVAIARTLVTEPEIVYADEPTGSLDRATGRHIISLLLDLIDQSGRTVVMVTHDPTAAAVADRVIYLVDGRVTGTVESPTLDVITAQLNEWES